MCRRHRSHRRRRRRRQEWPFKIYKNKNYYIFHSYIQRIQQYTSISIMNLLMNDDEKLSITFPIHNTLMTNLISPVSLSFFFFMFISIHFIRLNV